METIRTFVAVDVNVEQALKAKWLEIKTLLRNEKVKWVDEHTLHITLFFLGETQSKVVKDISKNLENELKVIQSFKIVLQGFGAFGNPNSPKIIWTGVSKSNELITIKNIVSRTIVPYGFKEETRDFSPHITLGRVKQMVPSNTFTDFISRNKSLYLQESNIEAVVLYRSDIKPNGPIYTPISKFKLLYP